MRILRSYARGADAQPPADDFELAHPDEGAHNGFDDWTVWPRQVLFPMAGDNEGWSRRLARPRAPARFVKTGRRVCAKPTAAPAPQRGAGAPRADEAIEVDLTLPRSSRTRLDGGTAATAGVPDGHYFESISAHSVVDPVTYAVEMKPPYIWRTCLGDLGPDGWLFEEYVKGSFQVLADGTRSGGPVLGPPLDYAFYLDGGTSRDMKLKGHF